MIKFFRKIRQNLLMENKTGKYFKYAIGEIILVVIGILIALSINNWNENRKANTYQNQVYKQIYNDIKNDSLNLINVIAFYNKKETFMNKIIYDSVPDIAYDTLNIESQFLTPYGLILITNFNIHNNTKKGYELFKTINNAERDIDSLSLYIEDYYSMALGIEEYSDAVITNTRKNINELQKKDWFLDVVLMRKLNSNFINYIKNSDDFKTRIFDYRTYAIRNYNRGLIEQQKLVKTLKNMIIQRLENQ
tara:strand:- start:45 stop:791 length:747 start_codon:yes stop_codon:yes gene_type:complete